MDGVPDARRVRIQSRLDAVRDLKAEWEKVCEPLFTSDATPINPFRVTREFTRVDGGQ